jgi:hypothetical protein
VSIFRGYPPWSGEFPRGFPPFGVKFPRPFPPLVA